MATWVCPWSMSLVGLESMEFDLKDWLSVLRIFVALGSIFLEVYKLLKRFVRTD